MVCHIVNRHRTRIWRTVSGSQQIIPRALQRMMQPLDGRQQDVHMAGLDLLDGADVQVHQFGQFLLGDFTGHPLPADVSAETLDLSGLF